MALHSSIVWWIVVSLLLLSWSSSSFTRAQQQQDPTTLNGGSVLAMAGKECVALAMDKRFGSGPQMVNIASRHVLTPQGGHLMVAFTGLEGDVQSLSQELSIQISSKLSRALGFMASRRHHSHNNPRNQQPQHQQHQQQQHHQIISPSAMAMLTSHVLYGRKQSPYFVEPLVVGLEKIIHPATATTTMASSDNTVQTNASQGEENDKENQINHPLNDDNGTEHTRRFRPFLCAQDCLGAQSRSEAFVCAGLASKSLYGTAEALWRPNLPKEDLARICGKAFLSALERDCLSGYGAMVYLITKDGIEEYDLACRND
mmetsp:Transcript_19789/g.30548  ORF Transcript_19789/g.30548 Transcript_19789/m.30548 type:complete len:315 (+) Transcript_19789:89-1033(+)